MSRLFYMLGGIALAAAIGMTPSAKADNEQGSRGFIGRDSRIKGCIAIVDKVRDGIISPTEWLEQAGEEFEDLKIELKKRNYKAEKAKQMMMGMAISLCMERKAYWNKCIADSDNEDADLQVMETAPVYSCWSKNKRAATATHKDDKEGASAPSTAPSQSQVVIINPALPVIVQAPTPPVATPAPTPEPPVTFKSSPEPSVAYAPPPPPSSLPYLSAADRSQFDEDVSIISQPVRIIGDDEGGKKEARFASCSSYWQSLHYNRSPDARRVLFAVRVARCMYRANYALMRGRAGCQPASGEWAQATNILLQARCYARF